MENGKDFYPKVGDKFYWKSIEGEIMESVCKHIEKNEGVVPMYFTSWDEHGGGFINEINILDPDSDEVKELLKEKEKKVWKDFWTQERIDEFLDGVPDVSTDNLMDFINLKTK